MNGKKRLLVIDRDPRFGEVLQLRLQDDGFEVQQAADAQSGLRSAYEWHPNGILIEVNLPGVDGFEACRRLREMTDAAIVIVSVRGTEQDVVRGLEAGADDYIVKPFEFQVLRARLLACLRRGAGSRPTAPLRLAKSQALLMGDPDRRLVFVGDGRSVQLTPKEYELLQYLVRNRGRVLSADAILANVWGPEYSGERVLVKQFIYRLRLKLEPDASKPEYIVTVRGSGYALEEDTRPTQGSDAPSKAEDRRPYEPERYEPVRRAKAR